MKCASCRQWDAHCLVHPENTIVWALCHRCLKQRTTFQKGFFGGYVVDTTDLDPERRTERK